MSRRTFILLGALGLLGAGGIGGASWSYWRDFGSLPWSDPVSPNWRNGEFHNLPDDYENPDLDEEPHAQGGLASFLISKGGLRYPPEAVKSVPPDFHTLHNGEFVWLGHSSYLLRIGGRTYFVDPVLSSRASPIPFTIPAWEGSNPYRVRDFPYVDVILITHDHWDHLDRKAIDAIECGHILCGKGVGAHLRAWGHDNYTEMDWWDRWQGPSAKVTFTPARHFSGRGFTWNRSLWGGFVVDAGKEGKVYFTGDSGYGRHFAEVGERLGPFDIVFADSGQYNRDWAHVHMFPEEAVRAVRDVRGRIACPSHVGKFTLAWHPWDEPTRRFAEAADDVGQRYILPVIGQRYSIV